MEPTLEGAMALARGATGPLSPHLEAFVTSLIDQRYSVICVRAKSWRAAAFDTWLAEQGVDLADLGDAHIDEFHRRDYRPRSDCRAQPRKHESFALGQLLQYLRGQGLCAAVDSIKVPADALVASFEQFLRRDRGLAAGSIRGYRTSARDFLIHRFGSQSVDLSAVSATDIVGFVRQQARSLRPRGLKNVITALRAFLRFARYRGEIDAALIGAVPAVAAWTATPLLPKAISAEHARCAIASCDPIGRVLAIPAKKFARPLVPFLSRAEVDALLAAPDQRTWSGRRDHALMLLAVQTGLRLSEVTGLRCDDVNLGTGSHVRVLGKGRKERCTPLSKATRAVMAAWLREPSRAPGQPVFPNARGGSLSSHGVQYLLAKHVATASVQCTSLRRKRVSPHVLRHTTAMDLLQAGVEQSVIALWLGHESIETTQIYLDANLELKEKMLAKTTPPGAKPGLYRPDDALLAFLRGL